MSAIVSAAAQRLNTSVAGVTGPPELPGQAPGAPAPASATEVLGNLPTEFGGLTHIFGGGTAAESAGQWLPVNVGLEKPGGSLRGPLGGLVPDFRNAAQKAQEAVSQPAAPLLPVTTAASTLFQRVQSFAQTFFGRKGA